MNERQAMSKLRKDLLKHDIWNCIIYDGNDFAGRPLDMVAMVDSKLIGIEGKFKKGFSAFGMRDIRPNQITNLDMISQTGGKSFIFLFIQVPNKGVHLIIWDWNTFKSRTKLGSIKKPQLEAYSTIKVVKDGGHIPQVLSCL